MKRKLTQVEKHVRTWARIRTAVVERELTSLDLRIKRTMDIRDLRALKKVRKTLVKLVRECRGWTEAHL